MAFGDIITNAQGVIGAVGDGFGSLSEDFGIFLYIPVILAFTKAIIGLVKGMLFFRRGRRGRG